jgi:uncharacterized protein (DUF2236 family)
MSEGLFAPESVTWRVHADPAMLIGGMRALLVQALHPLAMAGVEQHSDYRADPWGRLQRTVEYVLTTTYGTEEEARRAGGIVQAVHKRVNGTDPVTGKTYSAEDPELLVWVHAVEVHSFLAAYRRYGGGRCTDDDADRYLAEQVMTATLVGLDPALVPASVADLRDYFHGVDDDLRPSPYSRDAAKVVLNPPLPLPLRFLTPIAWIPGAAAAGLMPRRLRAMHGIPWVPPADAAVRVAATALTRAMGLLPDPPLLRAAKARWAEAA